MPRGRGHPSRSPRLPSMSYVHCTSKEVCCSQCLLARLSLLNYRRKKKQQFNTGKSGGSGNGVHGGGDARAAAPLVGALHHITEGQGCLSHALSPHLFLLKGLMPGSPGSPWSAACACGMGLWFGATGFEWVMPVEEECLGFLSPYC